LALDSLDATQPAMNRNLRARFWIEDELVEEVTLERGSPGMSHVAEYQATRWQKLINEGRRAHVIVDDPDDPNSEPWFEARENGMMLVYSRSIGKLETDGGAGA
jgi:hypothetical protein